MNFRNYAPSIADTMSVVSVPSVRGSIQGERKVMDYQAPVMKPRLPPQIPKPQK